jgi:hypothetical protein
MSQPMQRLCKYPLLFSELLKYTPVADSPHAHMEIENALVRLREATSQVNRATDDARVKAVLEKTWLLQDRLVFPDSVRGSFCSTGPGRVSLTPHRNLTLPPKTAFAPLVI